MSANDQTIITSPHPTLLRVVFIKKILSFVCGSPSSISTTSSSSAPQRTNISSPTSVPIFRSTISELTKFTSIRNSAWDDALWNFHVIPEYIWNCEETAKENQNNNAIVRSSRIIRQQNNFNSFQAGPIAGRSQNAEQIQKRKITMARTFLDVAEDESKSRMSKKLRSHSPSDTAEEDDKAPSAMFEIVLKILRNCCQSPESIRLTARLRNEVMNCFFLLTPLFGGFDTNSNNNSTNDDNNDDNNNNYFSLRENLKRLIRRLVLPAELSASSTPTTLVYLQHLSFRSDAKKFEDFVKIFSANSENFVQQKAEDENETCLATKICDETIWISETFTKSFSLSQEKEGGILNNRSWASKGRSESARGLHVQTHHSFFFSSEDENAFNQVNTPLIAVAFEKMMIAIFSATNGKCLHFIDLIQEIHDVHSSCDIQKGTILGVEYQVHPLRYAKQILSSSDGKYLFCVCENPWQSVFVIDVEKGIVIQEAFVCDDDNDDVNDDGDDDHKNPSPEKGKLGKFLEKRQKRNEIKMQEQQEKSAQKPIFNDEAIAEMKISSDGKFLVTLTSASSLHFWKIDTNLKNSAGKILTLLESFSKGFLFSNPASNNLLQSFVNFLFTSDSQTLLAITRDNFLVAFHLTQISNDDDERNNNNKNHNENTKMPVRTINLERFCEPSLLQLGPIFSRVSIRCAALSHDNSILVTALANAGGPQALTTHNLLELLGRGAKLARGLTPSTESENENLPSGDANSKSKIQFLLKNAKFPRFQVDAPRSRVGGVTTNNSCRSIETGSALAHQGSIYSLEFAPNSNEIILSVSQDYSAKIWNCKTGMLLRSINELATFGSCGSFLKIFPTCYKSKANKDEEEQEEKNQHGMLVISKFRGDCHLDQEMNKRVEGTDSFGPVMLYSYQIESQTVDISENGVHRIVEIHNNEEFVSGESSCSIGRKEFEDFCRDLIVRIDRVTTEYENFAGDDIAIFEVETLNGQVRKYKLVSQQLPTNKAKSIDTAVRTVVDVSKSQRLNVCLDMIAQMKKNCFESSIILARANDEVKQNSNDDSNEKNKQVTESNNTKKGFFKRLFGK